MDDRAVRSILFLPCVFPASLFNSLNFPQSFLSMWRLETTSHITNCFSLFHLHFHLSHSHPHTSAATVYIYSFTLHPFLIFMISTQKSAAPALLQAYFAYTHDQFPAVDKNAFNPTEVDRLLAATPEGSQSNETIVRERLSVFSPFLFWCYYKCISLICGVCISQRSCN